MNNFCEKCNKTFASKQSYNSHSILFHKKIFSCECCQKDYCGKYALNVHLKAKQNCCSFCHNVYVNKQGKQRHERVCDEKFARLSLKIVNSAQVYCDNCGKYLSKNSWYQHLRSLAHIDNVMKAVDEDVELVESGLEEKLKTYRIKNKDRKVVDYMEFFKIIKPKLTSILHNEVVTRGTIKYRLIAFGQYMRPLTTDGDEEQHESSKHFTHRYIILGNPEQIDELLEESFQEILAKNEEYETHRSGWAIIAVDFVLVEIVKFDLITIGSFIPLSEHLKAKKCLLNVASLDNNCFLMCVAAYFFRNLVAPKDRRLGCSYTQFFPRFNIGKLEFPFCLSDIQKFEKMNAKYNFKINIYSYNGPGKFGVIRCTDKEAVHNIDLLLLSGPENFHFVLILSLSTLLRKKLVKSRRNIYFCRMCLSHFYEKNRYNLHVELKCNAIKMKFPAESHLRFKKFYTRNLHAFVGYGDIECLNIKISTSTPSDKNSYVMNITEHQPCCCSYVFWNKFIQNGRLEKMRYFEGPSCVRKMLLNIRRDVLAFCTQYLSLNYDRSTITDEMREYFDQETHCYICGYEMDRARDELVYDHSHQHKPDEEMDVPRRDPNIRCGNIFSITHKACNFQRQEKLIFPILYHSLGSYDLHLILLELGKLRIGKLDCIAKTREKFLLLTWSFYSKEHKYVTIRFLDSLKFLEKSLSKCVDDCDDFSMVETFLDEVYPCLNGSKDVMKKNFLPYEFLDGYDKLDLGFPSKNDFFSILKGEGIDEKDYLFAVDVYNKLKCKNMREYLKFYLMMDVVILSQVFQNFRMNCFANFYMDVAHFITLAGYSFDCCLSLTKVNLEFVKDENIIIFIQKSLLGGYCTNQKRLCIGNSTLSKSFDPTKPEKDLIMGDITNLYGAGMNLNELPVSGFRWLREDEISSIERNENVLDIHEGFIVECDIDYVSTIHNRKHMEWPILIENVIDKNNDKNSRLVATLYNKRNYAISNHSLSEALKRGLILRKVHRGVKFQTSNWIQSFVNFVSDLRAKASSKFYVDITKSIVNQFYGKTIARIDKYVNMNLVYNYKRMTDKNEIKRINKWLCSPKFKGFNIISKDLIGLSVSRDSYKYNLPCAVGWMITDAAKRIMNRLVHEVILEHSDCSIIYSDCDSLFLECYNLKAFLAMMYKFPTYFDFSTVEDENVYGIIKSGERVPGRLKFENNNQIVSMILVISPKMYLIQYENQENLEKTYLKKMKGTSRSSIDSITLNDFINVFLTHSIERRNMFRIASDNHILYTQKINKVALSIQKFQKRIFIDNDSVPYGSCHHMDETPMFRVNL